MNEHTNKVDRDSSPAVPSPPREKAPAEVITEIPEVEKLGVLIESLLKKPLSLAAQLQKRPHLAKINMGFTALILLSLLLYGAVIGSFSMSEQLWAAPLKIILGVASSALICFPSLYIFTCLTGADTGVKTLFSGLLATLALMGVLLIGFAPILWVFSQSTHSLGFIGFLMLLSWLVALFFAMGFLYKLLKHGGARKLRGVKVWTTIFLLVSLQMSTSLRPIIGSSESLLTNEKRFFIQHWVDSVGDSSANQRKESDEH